MNQDLFGNGLLGPQIQTCDGNFAFLVPHEGYYTALEVIVHLNLPNARETQAGAEDKVTVVDQERDAMSLRPKWTAILGKNTTLPCLDYEHRWQ